MYGCPVYPVMPFRCPLQVFCLAEHSDAHFQMESAQDVLLRFFRHKNLNRSSPVFEDL